MKALNSVLFLLISLGCSSVFALDDVTVKADAPATAEAGSELNLTLTFSIPETFHAYHPETPGIGLAPDVQFTELSGLSKKSETWPEPEKHTDTDGAESWEYVGQFSVIYTFTIPADAHGQITIKGSHSTQYCDPDRCFISDGEFSAIVDVKAYGPKLPEGEAPMIVAEAKFKGEARAGGKAELEVIFGVSEHYHFYHKDNDDDENSYGTPIKFTFPVGSGLTLVETIWPEPVKHVDDNDPNWVELELSHGARFTFIFDVSADIQGDTPLKATFNAQVCDADGCQDRTGEFVATLKVRGKIEGVNPQPTEDKADLSDFTAKPNGLVWQRDIMAASKASASKQLPMLVLYATDTNPATKKFLSTIHTSKFAKLVRGNFVLFAIDSLGEGQSSEAISMAKALGNSPVLAVLNFDGREIAKFTSPANVLLLSDSDVLEFVEASVEKLNDLNRDPRDAVDSHGFYLNFEYAREQAKKENMPLLVDFNGKNCPPCRKMEKYVFTVPEVHELMKKFVVVSIQNDIGNKTYDELWKKYRPSKNAGVPYYAVMDHSAKVLRGIGSTLPAETRGHEFLAFLKAIDAEKPAQLELVNGWPKGLPVGPRDVLSEGFDFEAKFSADKVKPGAEISLELHFKMKERNGPCNLYAPSTGNGIPLKLNILGSQNIEVNGKWVYPEYTVVIDGKDTLHKFYGHVIIVRKVKVPVDAKLGDTIDVWGNASGQFCDSSQCLQFNRDPKDDIDPLFGWHASATIAADGVAKMETDAKSDSKGHTSSSDEKDNNASDLASKSAFWFLVAAFIGGLATLLTPCVLPVLPLTIGFFVSQSSKGKSPFFTALIYCACIVGTFTLFGLLTSVLIGASGAQSISTNGYVNVFLGLLFTIFALSFLGMFELRVPFFITSYFNKKQMGATKEGKGYAKAFFSGSAFALISFSCTGPIAGMFLAGAAGGDVLLPTFAMFVFSLGMALPIFILGQFPSLMKKMPKSGGWMNALKVVFGFVEIGLAVMYFSQAEQAFGSMAAAEWVNRYIVIAIWAACSLAIAAYLFGLFRMPHDHDETKQIGVLRAMFAIGFLAFAVYMIPGMFGADYGKYLKGILPLKPADGGITLSFAGEKQNYVHGLPWNENFESGMLEAKAKNMPVFIDFTGFN